MNYNPLTLELCLPPPSVQLWLQMFHAEELTQYQNFALLSNSIFYEVVVAASVVVVAAAVVVVAASVVVVVPGIDCVHGIVQVVFRSSKMVHLG